MFLSVSTRIAGGFAVILLVLLVSSIISFSTVRSINSSLHKVVDEAAPMLLSSGELISTLLEKSVLINQHQKSRSKVELNQYESDYAVLKEAYNEKKKLMVALVEIKPELAKPFNQTNTYLQQYFELVPEVFSYHQSDVDAEHKVKDLISSYEDHADDLDSLIYDFSEDVFDLDQREILKSIGNLAREATVTTTDALNLDNVSTLNTVYKDIQSISKSLKSKLTELSNTTATESDYFTELEDVVAPFIRLSVGSENVLVTFIAQLTFAEQSKSKLAEAQLVVNSAIDQLRSLVTEVKTFADQTRDSALGTLNNGQITIIVMALIGAIAAALISWMVIRNIRSPLNRVGALIGELSDGNLTQTIQLKRVDEFGDLANSVRDLAERLRTVIGDIAGSSHMVATSAEETAAISRKGSDSINQQREQTELVATAMAEMSATVSEVASSASNALEEVQSANSETRIGQEIVEQNIGTINKLANEIERAAEVIDKLNEYSDSIGSVLDVIRGIADQTNLLALNAAIEAARAGEQGRGFAVVADEVRTLASKTQESTSEIQEMIERLQNGTKDAVNVMQRSQKEAQISVEQTAKAGEALQSITRAVGVINDMSTHIATSAEEQSTVTNEMHVNITTISSLAEQNAQGATEGLAASQQLADLAEQLQGMVSQFKY